MEVGHQGPHGHRLGPHQLGGHWLEALRSQAAPRGSLQLYHEEWTWVASDLLGVLCTGASLQESGLHSSLCSCLPQSGSEFVGAPQIWVPVGGPGADGGFGVVRCPQPPHHHRREAVELG